MWNSNVPSSWQAKVDKSVDVYDKYNDDYDTQDRYEDTDEFLLDSQMAEMQPVCTEEPKWLCNKFLQGSLAVQKFLQGTAAAHSSTAQSSTGEDNVADDVVTEAVLECRQGVADDVASTSKDSPKTQQKMSASVPVSHAIADTKTQQTKTPRESPARRLWPTKRFKGNAKLQVVDIDSD